MNAVLDIDKEATNVPQVSLTVLETINKRNEISPFQVILQNQNRESVENKILKMRKKKQDNMTLSKNFSLLHTL